MCWEEIGVKAGLKEQKRVTESVREQTNEGKIGHVRARERERD